MRQHHAFGVAGGTGGVLQKRDVAALARAASGDVQRQRARRWGRSFIRGRDQLFRVYDSLKRTHARPQQFGNGFRAAKRQQHANFRIVHDCRLPCGVLFDAVGAKWRVNGDGNRSGEKNSCIGYEEGPRRRKHQRDAPACGHATPRQLRCAAVPRGVKLAEGERIAALPGVAILSDQEMVTVGVMCRAIPQDIDESFGDEDSLIGCRTVQFLNGYRSPQRGAGFLFLGDCSRGTQNDASQIVGRVGLGSDAVWQTYPESCFQPRQQFHALQAAKTQIAVEWRTGAEDRQRALAAQFFEQSTDHFQHAFARSRAAELGGRSRHRIHDGVCILPREAITPKRGLPSMND